MVDLFSHLVNLGDIAVFEELIYILIFGIFLCFLFPSES